MYTVKKWGSTAVLGVSLIALAAGLAAFDANPADAPRVSADVVAASAPVALTSLTPAVAAPAETLVTPEALQRMVSLRAANTRHVGPTTECMAKVVYHEAANQALSGQLAVAQVILNRTDGGPTFPTSVCGVVNQTGQFFKTRTFKVPRNDGARWRTAVAVAMVAQEKRLAQVAPGALFYHAAYVKPAWSHQHQRIAQIGDQIFYR